MPLVSGVPVGLYAPKAPNPPVIPNPNNLIDGCKAVGCTGISAVSSFIEVSSFDLHLS
jgi:hypothetical protein